MLASVVRAMECTPEDGLGWTIALSDETGQVVLTASGDRVAFVVFGAGIPF
ncbi:MAG: hypothetical protein HKO68_11350 [Desulfobacterales bacterium]|nr:hypothetical protein [Deltaproteobacteria bacterium]NNL76922.1 hypothetical protein [Desulfobacterales bacterium]